MSNESKKQILKATSIIGGAQFMSIAIGVFRTKVVALLLGPYGLGVVGMLQSIIDLVRNLTGFGLNYSAVKDVAASNATGNTDKINETITVLRNLVLWSGLLGTVLTIILSKSLGEFTFGNTKYTLSIIYISITLLLSSISGGQMALLQGKREISSMAKATVYSAVLTTVISVFAYYFIGVDGIVPVLILTSLSSLFFSWYFSKNIEYKCQKISFKETLFKGVDMAKLGFFIVVTSFMATLTLYLARVIIVDKMGIEGVGFFQASWMISTTYIGVILNAMLSDFFPRLSEIKDNDEASNVLINEQLEIALVLGSPMILVLMGGANLVIRILYSSSFINTVSILQWQLFAAFFTLIVWPLGVLFLAKNKGKYCVLTDGLWSVIFLSLVYFSWNYFGFKILGFGDLIAVIGKLILVYFLVKKIGGFGFSKNNINNIIFYGFFTCLMITNVLLLKGYIQYFLSFSIISIVVLRSFSVLDKVFELKKRINFKKK